MFACRASTVHNPQRFSAKRRTTGLKRKFLLPESDENRAKFIKREDENAENEAPQLKTRPEESVSENL